MNDYLETLILYIQNQDKRTERLLVDVFYSPVFHIAYSMTKDVNASEDIVQDTFVKIFSKLEKLHNPEKIEPWVKTIARRSTYDWLRKQKKWNESEWKDVYIDEHSEIEVLYEEKEIQCIIEEIIEGLEPLQREILRLKLIEEYSDEAIARELSIKVGTVKSRVHRAKAKVKERLMKGGQQDETIE